MPISCMIRAGRKSGMNVTEAILQRWTQRVTRMRSALERLDDAGAEAAKVGPRWNVRDLVGHFVYWNAEAAARMPELASGKDRPRYDLDQINEEVYRKYRRMSYVMLLPQLRASEQQVTAAIRAVPPALLIDSPVRSWIDDALMDHYDHHWPGLRDAVHSES